MKRRLPAVVAVLGLSCAGSLAASGPAMAYNDAYGGMISKRTVCVNVVTGFNSGGATYRLRCFLW